MQLKHKVILAKEYSHGGPHSRECVEKNPLLLWCHPAREVRSSWASSVGQVTTQEKMGMGAELESQSSDRGEQGKQAGQSPRTPASGGRPSTRQRCPASQSQASQKGDRSSAPRGAGHERAGPKAVLGPVAATFSKAPSPQQGCLHGHHPDLPSPCSPLWDPLWRPDLCEAQPEALPFLG